MQRVENDPVDRQSQTVSPQLAQGTDHDLHTNLDTPSNVLPETSIHSPGIVEQAEEARIILHSPISVPTSISLTEEEPVQYESPWTPVGQLEGSAGLPRAQSLDTTQACLLRYYVDHISPWVCSVSIYLCLLALTVPV